MAKLYFRYSAMNAGKSTLAIQVAHNYKELNLTAIILKPSIDTKGEDTIISRIGISRKTDALVYPNDSIIQIFSLLKKQYKKIDGIIVDEAQFLEEKQVDELYYITKKFNIPIICYGIRCDFQMKLFPGSLRLLAIADTIEEVKNMCKCGKKATQNLRKVNGIPVFEGNQVAIDGKDKVTYEAVCGKCYIEEYLKNCKDKVSRRK